MRILTIVSDLGFGGTQRTAQNYALAFLRAGHESAVLAWREAGPRERTLRDAGVELFVADAAGQARDAAVDGALAWAPDVVHVHRPGGTDPPTGAILRAARERLGARAVILETNIFARVDYSRDRRLIDVHCQLSRWCLWKWTKWSRAVRPRPIGVVVPNMVVPDDFGPIAPAERAAFRARHAIPADALVFTRVGSPLAGKWHPVVLDAFARFAAGEPRAWLVLVGCPPELRPRIAEMPADARRRVVDIPLLLGDAALRECYGSCDVFLHASAIGESFGLVLCEALLCGLPVITLSTPAKDNSQLEVVGHERGGLVVADGEAMVRAMCRLAADPALRGRYAKEGAAWVAREFGPARVTDTLLRIIGHARSAASPADLRRALRADPSLVSSVTDREIRSLLRGAVGVPPLRQRVLMRVVHMAWLYRLWFAYRHAPRTER